MTTKRCTKLMCFFLFHSFLTGMYPLPRISVFLVCSMLYFIGNKKARAGNARASTLKNEFLILRLRSF